MATTELSKIPETVLSRSQVFEFKTISSRQIADQLRRIVDAEKITVEIDGDSKIELTHDFSEHEREILLAGGLLSYLREREPAAGDGAARARAGEERTVQQDAGEAAEGSEDGEPGVIRQSAQGVGGQHE